MTVKVCHLIVENSYTITNTLRVQEIHVSYDSNKKCKRNEQKAKRVIGMIRISRLPAFGES